MRLEVLKSTIYTIEDVCKIVVLVDSALWSALLYEYTQLSLGGIFRGFNANGDWECRRPPCWASYGRACSEAEGKKETTLGLNVTSPVDPGVMHSRNIMGQTSTVMSLYARMHLALHHPSSAHIRFSASYVSRS